MAEPKMPSREEMEKHNATHAEYRTWCPHCVAGRGMASHHCNKSRARNPTSIPIVVMDYCFPSQSSEDAAIVLAMRDSDSKATNAMMVPRKGNEEWIMKAVVGIIDYYGHGKVILKSDGERAIVALKKAVKMFRQTETIIEDGDENIERKIADTMIEESPVGDSQANGAAEKTVQDVENMIRTWKSAVEQSYGCTLPTNSVLMPYIVQHAGLIITRYRMGADGLTPYQRLKGRKALGKAIPLAEKVLYMPMKSKKDRKNALEPRFKYGIWAGIIQRTGEYIILTPEGQTWARSI